MHFKYEDTRLASGFAILLIGTAALTGWVADLQIALLVALVVGFTGLSVLILNVYRSRAADDVAQNEHQQALLFINSTLNLRAPLPMLTGWAASPQLVCTLIQLVREHKPTTVVELGSGSSTLAMGYAVEEVGQGRIIALDHLAEYANETTARIHRHQLDDCAEVCHAPLVEVDIDGETWPWYDLSALGESSIDLLFVDGPPHKTRPMARYPAVPMLASRLSDTAIVVLDDVHRSDEQAIAEQWLEHLPGYELEYANSPYGTAILRRPSSVRIDVSSNGVAHSESSASSQRPSSTPRQSG
jgi:predicted O-methyltransferase YrrM